jgi:hypothetical protein
MKAQEIETAKKMIEKFRPAEGYSTALYEDGNLGVECRYPDITKIFWTMEDVERWVNNVC